MMLGGCEREREIYRERRERERLRGREREGYICNYRLMVAKINISSHMRSYTRFLEIYNPTAVKTKNICYIIY